VFFVPDQPAALQDFEYDFERLSFYGYEQWRPLDQLAFVGGLAYDRLTFPENFRSAPLSDREDHRERVSPKAGFIWTADRNTMVRAAYTRSLAGASFDQSFQLEPSQVAGFNQSFRSIVPESVGGAEAGAEFETYGISFERKFGRGTYFGLTGEILNSNVKRTQGAFDLPDPLGFAVPSGTREELDYREESVLVTFNQLLGNDLALGGRYRLSWVRLKDQFPEIPDSAFLDGGFRNRQELTTTLHVLNLYIIFNHPSGFFAQFDASWYLQSNGGYSTPRPNEEFWHFDFFAGYRFLGRRVEAGLGVLNLTDRDYRLNPLAYYNELPRQRTFVARLSLSF
jgi:outer membrane receptor protein involved in Fe transport